MPHRNVIYFHEGGKSGSEKRVDPRELLNKEPRSKKVKESCCRKEGADKQKEPMKEEKNKGRTVKIKKRRERIIGQSMLRDGRESRKKGPREGGWTIPRVLTPE